MDNIAGTPVEGGNFFGRGHDLDVLSDILENHDILLLGPRRIGKTSIARAIMKRVQSQGWRAVEINVASCMDERGVLEKLNAILKPELESLAGKAKAAVVDPLQNLAGRIKKVTVPGVGGVELAQTGEEDWTAVANDLLRLLGHEEARWLVYIDELPIFLFNVIRNDMQNGVQRVRRFLDWFRNDVRGLPGAGRIRWLVSGSVGLDTLVQLHGMADTINSMKHQTLEAYSEAEAAEMLGLLAARYTLPWSPEAASQLISAVQWPQPYYLQAAFHHLRVLHATTPATELAHLVEQAIDKLAQPGEDNDFHHWEGRLSLQLTSADAGHALALLNRAARSPQGARPEDLLADLEGRMPQAATEESRRVFIRLRDILQRDAYWQPDESSGVKRYRFRLEPLRRWWLRRDAL